MDKLPQNHYYVITVFASVVRKLAAKTIASNTEKTGIKIANNEKICQKNRVYIVIANAQKCKAGGFLQHL